MTDYEAHYSIIAADRPADPALLTSCRDMARRVGRRAPKPGITHSEATAYLAALSKLTASRGCRR